MSEQPEPREVFPMQMNWDGSKGIRDFGPRAIPSESEVQEVEETVTPAPKGSSVPESVTSPTVPVQKEKSESPAPDSVPPIPTQVNQQDADLESGKASESNEDESSTAVKAHPSPSPAPSLPSSSSTPNPGKLTPPAPAKPPTSG